MNRLKKINLIVTFALVGYLFFTLVPTVQGFIAFDQLARGRQFLLLWIDRPQWVIGYRFGEVCPAEFRENEEELKKRITEILQAWLKPLRELHPERPITDDFQLILRPDFREDMRLTQADIRELQKFNLRITFTCKDDRPSSASVSPNRPPDVHMRKGTHVDEYYIGILAHEVGHAFGLADTATHLKRPSTGGLPLTAGKQPSSLMASIGVSRLPHYLADDDKKGIIWLYKYLYEQLPVDDCFFRYYVFEEETRGCRPKYPLIYEAKHGKVHPLDGKVHTVTWILQHDPTIDVNARGAGGFTALHYAVQRGHTEMVKELLAQNTIKVNLFNKDKRTPAQLARHLKRVDLAKMIEAHPTAKLRALPWDVSPEESLTTTWGALKSAR